MKRKRHNGFTLVELLIVITIIMVFMGIALPGFVGQMKQRNLKGTAQILSMGSMQARSAAIAQREDQFLCVFVNTNPENISTPPIPIQISGRTFNGNANQNGAANTVVAFDSQQGSNDLLQANVPVQEIPKFIRFTRTFRDNAVVSFALQFRSNGSLEIVNNNGSAGTLTDGSVNLEDANPNSDLIIEQKGTDLKCFVDVVKNTGQVFFSVK